MTMRSAEIDRAFASPEPQVRPASVNRVARAQILLAALLGPLVALLVLGDGLFQPFRYERDSVLAGEWWRLITGPMLHFDTPHLAVNAAVILAWLYLFDEQEGVGAVLFRVLACTILSSLGMLLFSPGLHWMIGASAVTYALVGGSAFRAALEGPRPLGLILLAGLTVKLLAEQVWDLESWFAHFVDYAIVSEAHVYGVAAGLVFEAARILVRTLGAAQNGGRLT